MNFNTYIDKLSIEVEVGNLTLFLWGKLSYNLGIMGIIEKWRERDKKEDLAVTGEEEVKGPTIKEILANKEQSELFGEYLGEEGEDDLGQKLKLAPSELNREDFAALGERRKEFLGIIERSKNTLKLLDAKTIEEMVGESPELKNLSESGGPEVMRAALARYLPKLAILDRERFIALNDSVAAIAKRREAIEIDNKEIKKLCERYGIDEDKYLDVMRDGDPDEIAELVKEKISRFRRMLPGAGDLLKKRIAEFDRSDLIRQHLEELDGELREAGGALEATLMDNEILRAAFSAEVALDKESVPKPESGASFSEVKRPKEDAVAEAWEKFGIAHEKKYGFKPENSPDEHYEEALEEFSKEYTKSNFKGKQGFWARVCSAFWSSMVEDMVRNRTK